MTALIVLAAVAFVLLLFAMKSFQVILLLSLVLYNVLKL